MSGHDGGSLASSSRVTSPVTSSFGSSGQYTQNGQTQYMHTHSLSHSSSTHITPSLLPAQGPLQAPTLITYGSKSVRARVDREVPIDEIIRQLCASPQLAIQEPPALFCLRDSSNNDLITADNIQRKLATGVALKLVASPVIEAADTIEKLLGNDKQQVKQATFSLRGLVREEAFVTEFLARSGVAALASVIQTSTGNTLAYALNAMQSLLDLDEGWDNLTLDFVVKIISIISTQTLVNIVRPALSILKRFIISDQPSFGFTNIWPLLAQEDGFFKALAFRITREGDKLLTGGALALLNAIMKTISKEYFLETVEKLEAYKFRKAVISLIENHAEDVTPHILQFQQNCANIWHQQQSTPVNLRDSRHLSMLQAIYTLSGLSRQHQSQSYLPESVNGNETDYRKLGFSSDLPELERDFQSVGLFGLYGLYHTASNRSEDLSRLVLEQVNRPDARRCPIALVSLEVSRLLADQFDISGSLASASFQPFLLDYFRVHLVVMEFFIRIFQDSGATSADFGRVSTLVMSQVRLTLGRESLEYQGTGEVENGTGPPSGGTARQPKSYFALKAEFEDAKYEDIRDRQMKEMEVEDDLLSKLPVRNLRDRLYRESFDFVRSQRIICLQCGAWFTTPQPQQNSLSASQRGRSQVMQANAPSKYRFYRLAANRRYLHYLEANEPKSIRPGVDDLPEKIDLSIVTEVVSGQSGRSSNSNSLQRTPSGTTSPPLSSTTRSLRSPALPASSNFSSNPLSITLLSQDSVLAELVAANPTTFSEWIDGFNLLLPDGFISTKETADFVQILTDIGVKIKLLDLSGERLEIPSALPVPIVPPPSVMFYYAE